MTSYKFIRITKQHNVVCFWHILIETTKQLGEWTNKGECKAIGDDLTCGPGDQKQIRTCIDGTNDRCTAADTIRTISCVEAGTELPSCVKEIQLGQWINEGICEAIGNDPTCGPGNQRQIRNCIDGTNDKCNTMGTEQIISCSDARSALPECEEWLKWFKTL